MPHFYSPEYLNALTDVVDAFMDAFENSMATQTETGSMVSLGLVPRVFTSDGQDKADVRARELRVAEAAGLASRAAVLTGAQMHVQGIGDIDPIANWHTMTLPKAFLFPDEIRTTCASIKGRLRALALDAQADLEGTLPFGPFARHPTI